MSVRTLVLAVVCIASGWGLASRAAADEAKPALALGDKAPNFTFTDTRFLERSLADLGDHAAVVVVFTTLDCPVAQRYLPKLKELEAAYRDRGVQFLGINVGSNDPLVEVAYQAISADWPFPVGKDFDGQVVSALGVERVPQVVVLDRDRKLRYRGRIDSQYRVGGVQPNAGREDLQEALDDVLADREVSVAETPVDGCRITIEDVAKPSVTPTYAEHVAGILQKHCQECHRDGGSAPFTLLNFADAVANAETIAEVVRQRRMPPAFAAKEHGEFVNHRELSSEELSQLYHWARGERLPGDLAKAPPPREWPTSKWLIGEPDLIVKMPKVQKLPASGYVPYRYVVLPHLFKEDTWVQKIQILPGNPKAVHHCNMAYVKDGKYTDAQFITGYVPGGDPMILDPDMGFKIPAGSMLVLQVHYVTTGEEATDETAVGFVFPKQEIDKEIQHFRVHNAVFEIPPGDGHHRVDAVQQLACNAQGIGMFVHMHLRGKHMTFLAHYPSGETETLLVVPNYSFDWQMSYRWPEKLKKFPQGTKIECIAHFDNSTFNPYNPDPKATVKEGQQTFEEMMYGFFFFYDADQELNLQVDSTTGVPLKQPSADAQASN